MSQLSVSAGGSVAGIDLQLGTRHNEKLIRAMCEPSRPRTESDELQKAFIVFRHVMLAF
jgi:hypothetical protein